MSQANTDEQIKYAAFVVACFSWFASEIIEL